VSREKQAFAKHLEENRNKCMVCKKRTGKIRIYGVWLCEECVECLNHDAFSLYTAHTVGVGK
jgi:ribosomal protein L37AE/L43A